MKTYEHRSSKMLENGSRVAVVGGGPAGSFFSYFLLDLAERVGLDLSVDIYEPRNFSLPAPQGCNMCAGVISETLVQNLATEGINLPASVVQRAIGSYTLHTEIGSQQIEAACHEQRIGVVFRGARPLDAQDSGFHGLDHHLLALAEKKGANIVRGRVTGVKRADEDNRITILTRNSATDGYDLLAVAAGVNTALLNLLEKEDVKYRAPKTTKAALREYCLGKETIEKLLGNSLHVFLLDIPQLDFAMIIPKGDCVSVCLLGKDINAQLLQAFLTSPEVDKCFPPGWHWDQPVCQCMPRINVGAAVRPYAERVVFIGDSGVSRLYKDGIGTAYRAAKAAANCAVLEGVSSEDFRRHYEPICRTIKSDNDHGRFVFFVARIIQRVRFARKAVLRMTADEQLASGRPQRMSSVLWDSFTGSAPYKDVLLRTLHPKFISRLAWNLFASLANG